MKQTGRPLFILAFVLILLEHVACRRDATKALRLKPANGSRR